MDAYIYQADIYCAPCGEAIKAALATFAPERVPEDPDDECTFDSDEYPKGPYGDGGGLADSPQSCGRCRTELENPLTIYGQGLEA